MNGVAWSLVSSVLVQNQCYFKLVKKNPAGAGGAKGCHQGGWP